VVLAAGKGTRMKSAVPKVLHPMLGQPLVCYPLGAALDVGVEGAVVVLGHQHEMVSSALEKRYGASGRGSRLHVALQLEQLGTGHAARQALPALEAASSSPGLADLRVLILYGDTPLVRAETLARLRDAHAAAEGPLAIVTFDAPDPTGYGRIIRKGKGDSIRRVVEQKDCSKRERAITECNAGIYLCDGPFLAEALSRLQPNNAQGELYLTDLVELAAEAGGTVAVEVPPEEVLGVNDRVELARIARLLQRRTNEAHMKAGVTITDPDTTLIETTVTLDPDVELGPGCALRGHTRIGGGSRLDAGVVVTDCQLDHNVTVKPYSVLAEAQVGDGAVIGPFAHLRPGSVLGSGVHIGNFVETKKTSLGAGSKANHLAYLGDATIGSGVNVGAGTITCNYDGVNKHPTTIEDGVFIGSDTQLVAPVAVRQGAYVAAGTTVTDEVPAGALAISRSPQRNVEGYVERKRQRRAGGGA
jgi:bifunctional UDP-N-acetylglucosamine pyrophosphorylase/glucosamine-1-phosphate N-acetyltransferase